MKPDIRELYERAKALGIPTSKYYLNAAKEILEPYQKKCPITWNAFMDKKWVLPQYREEFYFKQELINLLNVEFIIGWVLGRYGYNLRKDEILNTKYITACKALAIGRPTYWLESELAKPLLETSLPEDFMLEDIHWRFPTMRIYLPKGLLTIKRENVDCSLMYLDITRAERGERMTLPVGIAKELKEKLDEAWIPALLAPDEQISMAATGVIDLDCPESGVGYAATTPVDDTSVKQIYDPNRFTPIASEIKSDALDNAFTFRMLRMAINILMLMGSYPLEYDPQEIIRAAKQEGKRTIPALLHAKFVGQSLLRPKHKTSGSGQPSGKEVIPHWTKGHWRRVAYGPKQSLRRLQWIGMYSTGMN